MINRVKRDDLKTTITGSINGADVSIIYESAAGNSPRVVTATANIKGVAASFSDDGTIIPAAEGCFINITSEISGQKNIHISGKKSILEVEEIITELEAEINAIVNL